MATEHGWMIRKETGAADTPFDSRPASIIGPDTEAVIAVVPEARLLEVTEQRERAIATLNATFDEAVDVHENPHGLMPFKDYLRHRLGTFGHGYAIEGFKDILERAERAEAALAERQQAIDKALSTMHSVTYVGGPGEREAWRSVLTALGPFETQHVGMDPDRAVLGDPPTTGKSGLD